MREGTKHRIPYALFTHEDYRRASAGDDRTPAVTNSGEGEEETMA